MLAILAAASAVQSAAAAPHKPTTSVSAAAIGSLGITPLSPPTPYMGVDTWYAFGPKIDQQIVEQLTDDVAASGMRGAGYRYVWLDAGWWYGARNVLGQIVADPRQWPFGMPWLTAYIHSRGLLAGIYTDAGRIGCDNGGSYGHYQSDIDEFAAWGFDAVKVDFCGAHTLGLSQDEVYRQFAQAIRTDAPRRPMLLAVANGSFPGESIYGNPSYGQSAFNSYSFGSKIATSWRTGPDLGWPGTVDFGAVVINIITDSLHPGAAGRGHWNDPDYLVPDEGLTDSEFRAQFTMWVVLAAPLMVSADISQLSAASLEILRNRTAIAINQDPLGAQGRMVAVQGGVSVWSKALAGGGRAVAFINPTTTAAPALADRTMLGLRTTCRMAVRDIWDGGSPRDVRQIRAQMPALSADLFLVTPDCKARHNARR